MSTVGQVWYGTSPHSPVSVSSSSSASDVDDAQGATSSRLPHRACRDAAPPAAELPRLLAYVAPTVARQFISLTSAQTHLEALHQLAHSGDTDVPASDGLSEVEVDGLCGGQWCAAYEVCSSALPASKSGPAAVAESSSPLSRRLWCYTLEPLPQEQRAVCRAVLCTSPNDTTSPTRAAPLAQQDRLLYDVLVTPLYVCTAPGAVRRIPVPAAAAAAAALGGVAKSAEDAEASADAQVAAERLLAVAPSCATLVYAVAQQYRHRRTRPPVALLSGSDAFAADVYATADVPPAPTALERQREAADDEAASTALAAQLARRLLGRFHGAPRQAVVWCTAAHAGAALRQRAALLSHYAPDLRRRDAVKAASSLPLSTTSGDVGGAEVVDRLCAAQQLLDALRPCSNSSASVSHVLDAVTLVLDEGGESSEGPARAAASTQTSGCRLLRAAVWRVVAFAAASASGGGPTDAAPAPEPDVAHTTWWAAHAAAAEETRHALAGPTPDLAGGGHAGRSDPGEAAVPAPLTVADIDACLTVLGVPAAQQGALHDLTYAAVHLAAVRFTSLSRSGHGPAEVAPSALPALHTAALLLRLPAHELATVLTTMEASEEADTAEGQRTARQRRHALNTAGAAQMQKTVVAHLGGILVDALVRRMHRALGGDHGKESHARNRERTRTVSLVVAARCDDGSQDAQDEAVRQDGGSGGGLQAWYAAYVRCHVALSLRSRLPAALRREACCEGVELEVDHWLDQLHASSSESSTVLDSTAAEARAMAARVHLPATELQATWVTEAEASTAAGAADEEGADGAVMPAMAAVARILDAVTAQCCGAHRASVHHATAAPLVSVDAVQRELSRRMEELAAFLQADEGDETAAAMTPDAARPEVSCAWTTAASATPHACADGVLTLTFPRGLHPPLRLSVRRLASDIFAAARLCAMRHTPGVHAALHKVQRDCQALLSDSADVRVGSDGACTGADPLLHLPRQRGRTVHQCLNSILAMLRAPTHDAVVDSSVPAPADYLCLVEAIAVPSRVGAAAVALDVRGPLEVWPEAEATQPAHAAPLSRTSHPTNNARGPRDGGTAAAAVSSLDDALTAHLRDRHPLLLALFAWSRLCHVHVCPVPVFAVEWAMPLLTALWAWPAVVPRTGREDAAALLHRARALRRHARYRELCLLALDKVPCFRASLHDAPLAGGGAAGGAVLGVSAVFLRASAVAAATAGRTALREAAGRVLQAAGRGALARRRCGRAVGRSPPQTRTAGAVESHAPSAAPSMAARVALEKARDAQLADTAAQRRAALQRSARGLRHAAGQLQRGWTETLELVEGEVGGAVSQLNGFEAQRRAAEDAARLEARRTLRAYQEAWAEVRIEAARQPAPGQAVQGPRRSPRVRARAEGAAGDDRAAAGAAQRLAQLKHEAVQSVEAALFSRVVRADRRQATRWVADHVRRQAARLTHGAVHAGADDDDFHSTTAAEVHRGRADRQRADAGDASMRATRDGSAAAIPAPLAARETPRHAAAADDGLVHTRPRLSTAAVPPRPLHEARGATPSLVARGVRGAAAGQMSVVSIERTVNAADASSLSAEWAVQRDLMALWEASHMTA